MQMNVICKYELHLLKLTQVKPITLWISIYYLFLKMIK